MFTQLSFKLISLFKPNITGNETDDAVLQVELIFASKYYCKYVQRNIIHTIILGDNAATMASYENFYSIIAAF